MEGFYASFAIFAVMTHRKDRKGRQENNLDFP